MKTCSRCKKEKELEEFHRDKNRKCGHYPRCKECVKKYHDKHSKRLSASAAEWNKAHPKRVKEIVKRYYNKNKERLSEKKREWRKENPEKSRFFSQRWRENNRERSRELASLWQKADPERGKIKHERRRARIAKVGGRGVSIDEWKAVIEKYEYKCLCCGKKRKLSMDHVIPISRGGRHEIENIQPLCKPCNSRKYTKTTDYR